MASTSELRVAFSRECNHATSERECATDLATTVQPGSLKALALLILKRNNVCNLRATPRGSAMQLGAPSGVSKSCTKESVITSGNGYLRTWYDRSEARIQGRLAGSIDLHLTEQDAEVYRRLCRDRLLKGAIVH